MDAADIYCRHDGNNVMGSWPGWKFSQRAALSDFQGTFGVLMAVYCIGLMAKDMKCDKYEI